MLPTDLTVDSACEAISERGIGVGARLGSFPAEENCCAPAMVPLKPQQNAMNKPMRICRCAVNDSGNSFALAVLGARVKGISVTLALWVFDEKPIVGPRQNPSGTDLRVAALKHRAEKPLHGHSYRGNTFLDLT